MGGGCRCHTGYRKSSYLLSIGLLIVAVLHGWFTASLDPKLPSFFRLKKAGKSGDEASLLSLHLQSEWCRCQYTVIGTVVSGPVYSQP